MGDLAPGKVRVTKAANTPPPCPFEKIIELYNETLPMLPQVRVFAEADRKKLATRWREDPKRQSLGWWRGFFTYVRDDAPFLVGQTHHGFRASLAWLVGPTNFAKVVNGNYDRRDPETEPLPGGRR